MKKFEMSVRFKSTMQGEPDHDVSVTVELDDHNQVTRIFENDEYIDISDKLTLDQAKLIVTEAFVRTGTPPVDEPPFYKKKVIQ